MDLDLWLIIALVIVVVILALLAFRLFRPATVSLTVGPGRQIFVGGTPYPPTGPASGHESFVVPRSAVTETGDDIAIVIRTAEEGADQEVSVSRRRLRSLHIDAALESNVVVYAGYEPPRMQTRSYAMEDPPRCIWCRGGIIVCGINPVCK